MHLAVSNLALHYPERGRAKQVYRVCIGGYKNTRAYLQVEIWDSPEYLCILLKLNFRTMKRDSLPLKKNSGGASPVLFSRRICPWDKDQKMNAGNCGLCTDFLGCNFIDIWLKPMI